MKRIKLVIMLILIMMMIIIVYYYPHLSSLTPSPFPFCNMFIYASDVSIISCASIHFGRMKIFAVLRKQTSFGNADLVRLGMSYTLHLVQSRLIESISMALAC